MYFKSHQSPWFLIGIKSDRDLMNVRKKKKVYHILLFIQNGIKYIFSLTNHRGYCLDKLNNIIRMLASKYM